MTQLTETRTPFAAWVRRLVTVGVVAGLLTGCSAARRQTGSLAQTPESSSVAPISEAKDKGSLEATTDRGAIARAGYSEESKPVQTPSHHAGESKPPHGGHMMKQPSPPLQPGVGRNFIEPPPLPESPAALRAIEAGETLTEGQPLCLTAVEELACANNPTLIQAKAQVDGTFGKAIQAGLWPNPTVGYQQEQIGVEGTAGEFAGGFVQQKIVTADKLDLSRAKFVERTRSAEWLAMAQEYRVLTDVRIHFYRTLGQQELVRIRQELLKTSEDHLVTTREKYNLGQVTRAEVHRANVMLQEERLALLSAENDYRQSFETLSTLVGIELPMGPLEGTLEGDLSPIEWDQALCRLMAESPELKAAEAKLRSDMITLKREKVEFIPNINVRGATGYNFETRENVASVSVFAEAPIFDWNQGTVKQAEADLVRQRGEVRRTQLRLRRRLAETYRAYLTALQHAENFQTVVVPESRKAYETQLDGYEQHRVNWQDVLDAQRQYNVHRAQYTQHLMAWREHEVLIAGYLLHGALEAPLDVTPPGHIESVPKPR